MLQIVCLHPGEGVAHVEGSRASFERVTINTQEVDAGREDEVREGRKEAFV